jgi:hypothetical protein
MPRPRTLTVLGLVAASVLGSVAYRRQAARRRVRVDLYYDDGSMLSLTRGSADVERLLPLAREVLGAVRTAA